MPSARLASARVGNDVVDLRDPEAAPGASHPRFDARVFRDAERRAIAASSSPHRTRWAHWAAKEAALKALRREQPRLPFHPRGFRVSLTGRLRPRLRSLLRGRVEAHGAVLDVQVEVEAEWVHAWVGESVEAAVARLEPGAAPSVQARILALAMARTRFRGEALHVERDDRIPTLVRTPFATTAAPSDDVGASDSREPDTHRVPLSLSHHGRFVACVFGPLSGLGPFEVAA